MAKGTGKQDTLENIRSKHSPLISLTGIRRILVILSRAPV